MKPKSKKSKSPAKPKQSREGTRAKLPSSVPVLEARHMHRGWFDHPTKPYCHCLGGWIRETVRMADWPSHPLCKAVTDEIRLAGGRYIPEFNDAHTPEENARVWNRAMARLGYVVGNPAAPEVSP